MKKITRKEQFLSGQDVKPLTRKEQILSGKSIKPLTRSEERVKLISEGGSGGGGSSDISTAEVTMTVNAGTGGGGLDGGIGEFNEGSAFISNSGEGLVTRIGVASGNSMVFTALLIKNQDGVFRSRVGISGTNPVITGSCELEEDDGMLVITGDCTITLDPVT